MWEKAFQKVEMMEEMVEGDAGWYKGKGLEAPVRKGRCSVCSETRDGWGPHSGPDSRSEALGLYLKSKGRPLFEQEFELLIAEFGTESSLAAAWRADWSWVELS